jgi:hypothetical protein
MLRNKKPLNSTQGHCQTGKMKLSAAFRLGVELFGDVNFFKEALSPNSKGQIFEVGCLRRELPSLSLQPRL